MALTQGWFRRRITLHGIIHLKSEMLKIPAYVSSIQPAQAETSKHLALSLFQRGGNQLGPDAILDQLNGN
jgi:hypothetical protein